MKLFRTLCGICCCAAVLLAGCAGAGVPTDSTSPTSAGQDPTLPSQTEAPGKTLKILAIGNSFSIDAMEYLYQIAQDGGYTQIVLGNLYDGGCSLGRHLNFATTDSPSYEYYKNTTGTWNISPNYTLSQALADEEWDYITLQQASTASGLSYTFEDALSPLLDYVQERNSTAKLLWHMTWAYQQDYEGGTFSRYGNDQMNMYNLIVSCVNEWILPEERFSCVIPTGTAIQNARTSFLGDTLTRDGLHLDYHIGRYIAALTWYAAITGEPIDNIRYNPSESKITPDMLAVAKESVKNALLSPDTITQSAFTS